jgi:hypothetical protein
MIFNPFVWLKVRAGLLLFFIRFGTCLALAGLGAFQYPTVATGANTLSLFRFVP